MSFKIPLGGLAAFTITWCATATASSGANVKVLAGTSLLVGSRTSAGVMTLDSLNIATKEVPVAGTLTLSWSLSEGEPGTASAEVIITSSFVAPTILFGFSLGTNFTGSDILVVET